MRWFALGGITGPLAFICGWLLLGLEIDTYSPIDDAISEIARVERSTHELMTAAFLVFGISIAIYALALKRWIGTTASICAIIHGLATMGVGMTPLGNGLDAPHDVFAAIAYVSLALLTLLGGLALTRNARTLSFVACGAITATLALSAFGPAEFHGLWQRVGLTVGDIWIVATAVAMLRTRTERGRLSS